MCLRELKEAVLDSGGCACLSVWRRPRHYPRRLLPSPGVVPDAAAAAAAVAPRPGPRRTSGHVKSPAAR